MQKEQNLKPTTNLKTKFYLLILLVGMALTGWSLLYRDKNLDFDIFKNEMKEKEASSTDKENSADIISIMAESYLEGRLENSDDVNRGNLKLISSIGNIYIRTARDFSNLLGFDVLVRIEGPLDNFKLIDIERRLEKNGYIQPQ